MSVPKTALICHDAGGANVLLAWLARQEGLPASAYVEGPALTLWRARFGDRPLSASPDECIAGADILITATSWNSDLEHHARIRARALGIRSIAVLDHWVNYRERFVRDGQTSLPDEIWVADETALRIAVDVFPGIPVTLIRNEYVAEMLAAIEPVDTLGTPELLYLLEPARSDWGRGVPGEFQALDFFTSRLHTLGLPEGTPIRFRPHPSDPPGKYDQWLEAHGFGPDAIDRSASVVDGISRARWVAGCESFALALALDAGRTVYCTLPPWAPACRLPHAGLIHLKEFTSH
ncbi:hypothetical protein [Noviherbaspirillum aridicola]|uniref:Uncharacterized protein n=1 Tax=Noviherbaspirillum aridicola TaxID=2849687 RepID=A0ABQ4Q2H1_9BURK|nr:hypothetical protein [Noviherbaspirillum aridicola]GIZ51298.1 hypothetical protein NCCP691_13120 [Noviherbaspirillum aridicola]